jgi:hypothetical protein
LLLSLPLFCFCPCLCFAFALAFVLPLSLPLFYRVILSNAKDPSAAQFFRAASIFSANHRFFFHPYSRFRSSSRTDGLAPAANEPSRNPCHLPRVPTLDAFALSGLQSKISVASQPASNQAAQAASTSIASVVSKEE